MVSGWLLMCPHMMSQQPVIDLVRVCSVAQQALIPRSGTYRFPDWSTDPCLVKNGALYGKYISCLLMSSGIK